MEMRNPTVSRYRQTRWFGRTPNPAVLIVFLPGRTSGPADYEKQGFVQAVRDRRIAADMVSADAHMGYYYR